MKKRYLSMAIIAFILTLVFPHGNIAAAKSSSKYVSQYSKPVYLLEVNKRTNKMYLYRHGKVIRSYSVGTGKFDSPTPSGTYRIVLKIVNPSWRHIPGGVPENPLGYRWMGLKINGNNGTTYGIHGNNNPASIGKNSTNGCIRMYNSDVRRLFRVIPHGTPVWIHQGKSNGVWRGNLAAR